MTRLANLRSGVHRYWLLALLILGPWSFLALTRVARLSDVPAYDSSRQRPVAATVAAVAIVLAVPLALAAQRERDGGLAWLAAGSLAVGILMFASSLLGSGAGHEPEDRLAEGLEWLAASTYAAALALAAAPRGRPARWAAPRPFAVLGGIAAVLTVPTALLVVEPRIVTQTSLPWEGAVRTVVALVVMAMATPAAVVYWRRWWLGGEVILLGLAGSAALTISAAMSELLDDWWRLDPWTFEGFMMAALVSVILAVLLRGRHSPAPTGWGRVFAVDPFVHIAAGYPETLQALAHAVEVKDAYTYGHSRRTAKLAVRLGAGLHLNADELRTLGRGAVLHDIGKIGVREAVLNKPGALDAAERREVERHPVLGAELARSAPTLVDTVGVILHHHERWDGTGYPDGLAGHGIPLLARICAVADVWDALTTDRVNRSAWTPADALAHIVGGAGTQFDPSIVDVLVELAHADLGPAAHSVMSLTQR
ncbi:MAG: HD-GYP domain-containing protein [Acidimicrobiales bacterium]